MRACSEAALAKTAAELALVLRKGDRVLLEGPMGAGKTTFARELLRALGVHQPPEGSPSFAIAHEYHSPKGSVVHIDFYRLKSEGELEDAGIPAYFWEREAIVISEWLSMFPDFETAVRRTGRTWTVRLAFSDDSAQRDLEITSE
ncbi:MAG: tRNA (adenosine(37)-N6)-threonylcarbamoyltransferase complex ATPase subunit type 1 TsaE [Bdellovibrionales bacterium GWB1_55_8]|nr:MAG: tRNA (adenosine(37)-N6)-threonylcarbamoyltransferase complex ATPase subunit type 1 TsaE [Bdellovibrionales bacterium GWB1_55_8]